MELGLDISKRYFDATLLKGVGKKEYRQFEPTFRTLKTE